MSTIKIFLKQWISPEIRSFVKRIMGRGSFDEIELLHELLNDDKNENVMIDVGAHHGVSLERFARGGWRIYAFEPDRQNRSYLEKMCRVYPNVSIDPRAVSDACEENRAFFSSEVSSGISGLTSFHPSHKESGRVATTTISAFCEEKGITQIHFLKMDAEGYDLFVLKGFPWRIIRPRVILCEFEDRKTNALGYRFSDMADYLKKMGYSVFISEWYPITEYGRRHRWRRFITYPCTLLDDSAWGNIIAVSGNGLVHKLNVLVDQYAKQDK